LNKYIEIPAGKGCLLFLTPEEYSEAVKRGKAIRRRRQYEARQQQAEPTAKQKEKD
jgi:hypothetical protein